MYLEIKLLGVLSLIVLFLAILERILHVSNLKKIKIRIHVNGTRGKSTVTRLIAAGLRESGFRVLAKTTGTEARLIFEDGSEEPIVRKRKPNISEQLAIVKKAAQRGVDVLVIECMALYPENQWVAEHMMINSTVGVITNVFADHLDVMGPTINEVAKSLSMTIPKKSIFVTESSEFLELFKLTVKRLNTELHVAEWESVSDEENDKFDYVSFKQNVAIALKVCELAGVHRNIALNGMWKAAGDPGAMKIIKFNNALFAGAFAANDYTSTLSTWEEFRKNDFVKSAENLVIINNRADRVHRIGEIANVVVKEICPDYIILVGDNGYMAKSHIKRVYKEIGVSCEESKILDITYLKDPQEIVDKIFDLFDENTEIAIFGVGNTKTMGEQLMQYFESNGEKLS